MHVPQFFQFPSKVEVLIFLFTFFQFYSVVSRDNKVDYFASSLFLLIIIKSGFLAMIRWSVYILKSYRSLCVAYYYYYYFDPCEFSHQWKSEWQQVSLGLQDSFQCSSWSSHCSVLDGLDSSSNFNFLHLLLPSISSYKVFFLALIIIITNIIGFFPFY